MESQTLPENTTAPVNDIINSPWYQSTQGPQISGTVKSIFSLIIPVLIQLHLINTNIPWLDNLIDIVCILVSGGYALYSYARAKKNFTAQLGSINTKYKILLNKAQTTGEDQKN